MKSITLCSAVLAFAMPSVVSAEDTELGTYLHGNWSIVGKSQGEQVKGRMTVRPAANGASQFYRWTMSFPDEVRHGSAIGGIDPTSGKVVEHAISQGTHWTNTYEQALTDKITKTTGTRVGTVRGQPYEGRITVERTSDNRFVYKVESDAGTDVDLVFERVTTTEGEKAFKAYAELAVGGTWVSTIDGERYEDSYEWILDGQFVKLTSKPAGEFSQGITILGVDPNTKQFTWWGFDAKGMVAHGTSTQVRDGVWIGPWNVSGPMGTLKSRGRLKKINADTITYEVLERTIDGDIPKFPKLSTWKREQ